MTALDARLAELVQRVAPGARLLSSWPLEGGISAQMTGLEVGMPGGEITRWVLRQYGALTLELNPRIAADEFRLLQILQRTDVPAPVPRHLEPDLFAKPCIVVDHIEGETGPGAACQDTYVGQLACCLARIHALGAGDALSFLPRKQLDPALQSGPANPPVLLHGDLWPGNVLSREGAPVAVIDWEDAATGDPLADLAVTRLELLWTFGPDAAERFTELYLAMTSVDPADLPGWDVAFAAQVAPELVHWKLDAATLRIMREQLAWFAARARERLARR